MVHGLNFYIGKELKTRWASSHLQNTRIKGWVRLLLDMRAFWRTGVETILETRFYELVLRPDDASEKGT